MKITKSLIVLLVGAGLLFAGYYWFQSYRERERNVQFQEATRQRIKSEVIAMARADNANETWEATLTGGQVFRHSPVLTAELQQVWLSPRPILFIGTAEDVIANGDHFRVRIRHAFFTKYTFTGSGISVNLKCPPMLLEPIVKAAKNNSIGFLGLGVAATARIAHIESTTRQDSEGNPQPVLTGYGECIHLRYIEENVLW